MTSSEHKAFKKKLFPKKAKHCAECDTRIGTSTSKRRHIAFAKKHHNGDVSVHAYQLCEPCAEYLLAEKMHMVPNLHKDMQQADLLALGQHVGGMQ